VVQEQQTQEEPDADAVAGPGLPCVEMVQELQMREEAEAEDAVAPR
jgi:hypothetical protein